MDTLKNDYDAMIAGMSEIHTEYQMVFASYCHRMYLDAVKLCIDVQLRGLLGENLNGVIVTRWATQPPIIQFEINDDQTGLKIPIRVRSPIPDFLLDTTIGMYGERVLRLAAALKKIDEGKDE